MPVALQINHALFLTCLAVHSLLAGSVFWIACQYMRHRRSSVGAEILRLAQPLPAALPRVLIQIPVFNEGELIARSARSIERLDWPRELVHVQILDDSTEDMSVHAQAAADSLRKSGIDAEVIARNHRSGFKAGALGEGLRRSGEEFIAILDADYVPEPDFLRACLGPLLEDARLAFVQARCDYINGAESAMTRAQQRLLDAHFAIEQPARNWSGQVTPFNGTCGVWRRSAIDDAGGWQGDTLAEDLDLSYRAQMKGWRALFLSTVSVKGELPNSKSVWRKQQFRWTKGFAEAGRKLLWAVWRSQLTVSQKVVSTFHLGGGVLGPLFAVTLVTGSIDLLWGYGATQLSLVLIAFSLIGGAFVGPALLIVMGQVYARGASPRSELSHLPSVLALQISTGLVNLGGAVDALAGRATAFERTPKSAENTMQRHYAPRA